MKADKSLLCSLIKDDLINYKLVSQLQALGLDATDYFVSLSSTVFKLMGYVDSHESDRVYEGYLSMAKRVQRIDLGRSPEALEGLAAEICAMLEAHLPGKSGGLTHPNTRRAQTTRRKSRPALNEAAPIGAGRSRKAIG